MNTENLNDYLNQRVYCRETQSKLLSTLLFQKVAKSPCVILYGPKSTAKTVMLRHCFSYTRCKHAWIDTQECFTLELLLYRTLIQLGVEQNLAQKKGTHINSFCNVLSAHLSTLNEHTYIVLDRLDELPELNQHIFKVLVGLSEFSGQNNVSVIIVMNKHPNRLLGTASVPVVHFPQYTKDEILDICQHTAPSLDFVDRTGEQEFEDEIELSVWMQYCAFLWDVFGAQCLNDYVAFREILDYHWPKFVSPIVEGDVHPADYAQLHKLAKDSLVSDETITRRLHLVHSNQNQLSQIDLNLSCVAKFLLISAFLASYNPSHLDSQLFSKRSSGRKIRHRKTRVHGDGSFGKSEKSASARNASLSRLALGPKPFDLERLIAIYYAISEYQDMNLFAEVFTQVSNLCTLKMIVPTKDRCIRTLDAPRFKVNIPKEYAEAIALSLSLDLNNYLANNDSW
ncbi:origin recognition complex subunit Orc5 [Schizosaccharomyces japonicus yFS275]|uniref:Origin recognition complex subunit Orc5 n=1 Tax=Schizosaccharomyces japonicus (strain yFS275 / FY16936) TaxID=402676 RepID=B6K498_SCHJY|nr:origin recognition complex subunit Orc5 [Schizosaccharomyces japonicus yFS275]EEB08305.1 origin recognition complex subunit Orc5 [Schizosaccharomyces japonicus yFS275]